jgi:hypothetical protein
VNMFHLFTIFQYKLTTKNKYHGIFKLFRRRNYRVDKWHNL